MIALVGMPGSGKSTVARHLARRFGLQSVDSDEVIERRIGQSIREFFETQGEDAFREVEQQVIHDLAAKPDTVLATGGGAVLRPDNREVLRRHRRVVYLRTTPEDLFRRLRHDSHRPLLQVNDPMRRLRDLFRDRDPLYRETAHYTVEAARPSVTALVNMVVMQLELGGEVSADPASGPVQGLPKGDAEQVP